MSGKDGFKSASPVCFSLRISFAFSLTSPNTMDSGPFGGKGPDLVPPSSRTDRLHYLADVYFAFPRTSTSSYAHNSIDNPGTTVVGHLLESDFCTLHLSYPRFIDTDFIHPGNPLKPGLAWLTRKWLGRTVQIRSQRKYTGLCGPVWIHSKQGPAQP